MNTVNLSLPPRRRTLRQRMKSMWPLYLMTVPFFILVILFVFVPLWGWAIAFFDYFPGKALLDQKFVGLKYFQRMLSDRYFFQALRNTLVLSSLALLTYPFAPIMAIMLHEMRSKKMRRVVQTFTSFPNFISWILVFSIFSALLSVDDGALNQLLYRDLKWLSRPSNLLANADVAWYLNSLVLAVWKGCGWSAIIYLASITGIDPQLYEAAAIDGAGRFRRIWHIIVPGLMPTFTVLFVLGLANILNTGFEQYYVFVNTVTFPKLDNLDTYIYRVGLANTNFSYGTALGMVRTLVSVALLSVVNLISLRVRGSRII